jgi:putative heme-binding domain-containing protein
MLRLRSFIAVAFVVAVVSGVFVFARSQAPAATASQPAADGIAFTTLPGFAIERLVPTGKNDTYVAMTFDSLGRLVVSKENDNPRLLLDNNKDGIYDTEKVISDKVKNCQGLWFDGRTFYGNCAPVDRERESGLFRIEDTNGDDAPDTFAQLSSYVGGIQEHGPHAIRRGPDGEMTTILGNNTFAPDDMIDFASSPFRDQREHQFLPYLPDGRGFGNSVKEGFHGVVFRFDRSRNKFVMLWGGLRNAYDFAYNLAGESFTFDSDMEWDINLPWYRDVRSVHGIPGGNYGYRNGSGKFPAYFIDSLPPLREVGRGSPVGVEFYQHNVYPAEFDDAYFEADWSRGRILYTALKREGATYTARSDRAEFVHGEPLNVTDTEVGPDGLLYFTTGGRDTEGGVYRVKYTGAPRGASAAQGIMAVVRQPQPLSSWGWAAIENARASMGASFGSELLRLARDSSASGGDRAQAIYMLQRHGAAPAADVLQSLVTDSNVDVRAAVAYVAGVQGSAPIAAAALKDSDSFVKRRAAEALVRIGQSPDKPSLAPVADIYALMGDADRFTRWAGRLALQRSPRADWRERALNETNTRAALEGMVALLDTQPSAGELQAIFDKQVSWMKKTDLDSDDKLRLIRTFNLAAVTAPSGASATVKRQVHDALIGQFPSQDERMNRELATTLVYTGQADVIGKILAAMPDGDENQQLQIHYMYALRTMKQGWTADQKSELTNWFAKAVQWHGGSSFTGFINQMFDASLETFTAAEKKTAYQMVPQFAPLTATEVTTIKEEQAARARAGRGGRGPNAGAMRPANARAKGVQMLSREEILEYQMFVPVPRTPDLAAGHKVFEKACSRCHRFGAVGTDFGPDLSTLSSRFKKKDVLESILWPSKTISDQYAGTIIETKDGQLINGLIARETPQAIQVRTADAIDRPIVIEKAQVKEKRESKISLMPENLLDEFSQLEIQDLLAFVLGRPPGAPSAAKP